MTEKRKYSKCLWCGRTIDVTNHDIELCEPCSKFPSERAMLLSKDEKRAIRNGQRVDEILGFLKDNRKASLEEIKQSLPHIRKQSIQ